MSVDRLCPGVTQALTRSFHRESQCDGQLAIVHDCSFLGGLIEYVQPDR